MKGWLITFIFAGCILTISASAFAQTNNTVRLVAESDTFVPANYSAKRPISVGSDVNISAIGPSRNNHYEWLVNGRKVTEFSGLGQSSITLALSDRPVEVTVKVLSNNELIGTDTINIIPQDIKILFYLDHPTRGPLYHHALEGTIRASATNLGLIAIPYGSEQQAPLVQWKINDSIFGKSSSINLPKQESDSMIKVSVKYDDNIFSRASNFISVIFSNL